MTTPRSRACSPPSPLTLTPHSTLTPTPTPHPSPLIPHPLSLTQVKCMLPASGYNAAAERREAAERCEVAERCEACEAAERCEAQEAAGRRLRAVVSTARHTTGSHTGPPTQEASQPRALLGQPLGS